MRTGLPLLAGTALLFCATGHAASTPMPAADAASVARLDTIFARWAGRDSPGCSIAIARSGQPIAMRSYGMANLELGVPATVDSIYEAGSDSKQFTSAAILMLARERKLSLADDIRKYLPEMPTYSEPVTIAHLLHHTSGLRDWGSVAAIQGWPRNSRTVNNDDTLAIAARQVELNFTPGTHYLYSNSNYNLLAIIVARVSGQTLADFTHDRIFVPLGMEQTRWRDDHGEVVPGRTGAYERAGGSWRNDQVIEDAYGNGGLLTTVGDLTKWQAALDSDFFGAGFTAQMQQTTKLNDGTPIAYALALVNLDHHGQQEIGHSGSTGGYRAWMARYPAQQLAVSLLCNAGDVDAPALGRAAADIFLPPYKVKTYTPKGLVPTGLYADVLTGAPIRFERNKVGDLQVDGRSLTPVGSGRWQSRDDVFVFDRNGSLVREAREGERVLYRKVEAVAKVDPTPYLGRFCSAETETCLTVAARGGRLVYSGPRWRDQPLEPAYSDVFTGGTVPRASRIVVKFQRDSSGAIAALRFGESRAFDLLFVRAD